MFIKLISNIRSNIRTQIEQIRYAVIKPLEDRKSRGRAERVLSQMGFAPDEIRKIIAYASYHQLMSQCLGQLVWRVAKEEKITPQESGKRLSKGYYWCKLPSDWQEKKEL